MLGNNRGKMICKHVPDYVLFDLETTGISCYNDEVIEISAVKVRNGKVVDEFSELVNPGMPIPYAASAVNNITDKMVAKAPSFEEILPAFLEFIGDDILVGHNINSFDMKFIYRDCEKYWNKTISNDYIDTLKIAAVVFPDWRHRRLSDLAEYYGLSTVGAHRALADCKMNQVVFEKMGEVLASGMSVAGDGSSAEAAGSIIKICPRCSQPMKKRNGKFGEFWGCTGFPDCRHTENI